jgi:hypothetical protein
MDGCGLGRETGNEGNKGTCKGKPGMTQHTNTCMYISIFYFLRPGPGG